MLKVHPKIRCVADQHTDDCAASLFCPGILSLKAIGSSLIAYAAYDKRNLLVHGWQTLDYTAQCLGIRQKVNGISGAAHNSQAARQPGIEYRIKVRRYTDAFYVYIMVASHPAPIPADVDICCDIPWP